MIILRNKLFGIGGESAASLQNIYDKGLANDPNFANTSRGKKLMDRINYERQAEAAIPKPTTAATVKAPATPNVPATTTPNLPAKAPTPNVPAVVPKQTPKPKVKAPLKFGKGAMIATGAGMATLGFLAGKQIFGNKD